MDVQSRIRALEEQLSELRATVSQHQHTATAKDGQPPHIRFVNTTKDGDTVLFITLQNDGRCLVNGQETDDPLEIGKAVLRFQKTRVKTPTAQILSLAPKGEA